MMQVLSSPVAFFCYNRPEHTRITLEALRKNYLAQQSRLFIFSDGPKDEKSAEGVKKVREYISSVRGGFASVEIVKRARNYGCAGNIIDGISQVVNEFGRIIVVEDDILTSPHFLTYINDALELYKDDDSVGTVSGYLKPGYAKSVRQLPQSFFARGPFIWGWGTWQRVWKDYNYDAAELLTQIRAQGREDEFNYGVKSKPNSRNLQNQADGKVGTWDYQLSAGLFLQKKLSLTSGRAYSNNIGFDGTGVHCGTSKPEKINVKLADSYEPLKKIPVELYQPIHNLQKRLIMMQDIKSRSLVYRGLRKIYRVLKGKNKVSKS